MTKVYTIDRLPEKDGEYFAYSVSEGRFIEHFNTKNEEQIEYWKTIIEWWMEETEPVKLNPVFEDLLEPSEITAEAVMDHVQAMQEEAWEKHTKELLNNFIDWFRLNSKYQNVIDYQDDCIKDYIETVLQHDRKKRKE